jgi:2,3-bisphosphoglycerate-independent phosphoglycerate mutase
VQPQVLLIFVDGLGLGPANPETNPIHDGACPALERFLREHAVPMDVTMGVRGVPQSATGQTALFTGVNAAQAVGRHVEGFPGARLRKIVEEHGILGVLLRRGLRATFANAYFVDDVETVRARGIMSVTTVAMLGATGDVRNKSCMERNEAVYHDFTRETLRERGYAGPLVAPAEAAQHLLAIAREHELTLFEHFLTDHAGHRLEPTAIRRVLSRLDEFLATILQSRPANLDVVLTSDHGNIEDATQRGHTTNPVPFAAVGPHAGSLKAAVRAITDVTPALLSLWDVAPGAA